MLWVRVLGELEIEVDGREVEPPASRRARSLLGLLVVDRRSHARSQLAARFWPEVLDESARTSLRGALSALRKAIGSGTEQYVLADRDTVALAGEPIVRTDIGEFEALLAAGRDAEAVELARGELLDGLDDDWVYEARDAHRERVGQALARLAAQAEERGELGEAAALTRRQVALDPLAEGPQRELIRRLAAAGDRPAALLAYRRLQDRLRNELRIAPAAATRELVASLREPVAGSAAPEQIEVDEPAVERAARDRHSGTVTLLFTDEVSSTERLVRLGDDEAARLRRAHFALLRELAASHGGQEVKNLGDGLMVAFASAVDGVACAVAIQQAVHQETEHERLTVRVGLNVGEPVHEDDDYFGTPVVLAKRLCDAASDGQILAADVVRTLVGSRGGFQFRALGEMQLKGLPEPLAVSEVCWEATAERSVPLPPAVLGTDTGVFVGRAAGLAELERHWAAARLGERRVVMLAGDAGIGKTRLAAELCRRAHVGGAAILAGRCHEEMVVPYEPFVEALRNYVAGCAPSELAVQLGNRRADLARLLPELGEAGSRDVARGASDGEQERLRIGEAVAAMLVAAARLRPLILLLDDLQWADDASLLLLLHVIRATADARLLILGTLRQTELDRGGRLGRALAELRRGRELHQLELGGLAPTDVAALIAARAGVDADEAFAEQVGARTDGNPFFIEELLRHVSDPAGDKLAALELPDSVKDLLLRRLRGLGEDCLRALAFASVVGGQFDLVVLERVLDMPIEELAELLEGALEGYVLVEEASPVGRYRFAHPLIRETIYGDISLTRRALMHRRVGTAIESLFGDQLPEHAAALAHHFHAAGDRPKAFEYHVRAADAVELTGAVGAAIDYLTSAIATAELLGRTAEKDPVMRRVHSRRAWLGLTTGRAELARRDLDVALAGARAAEDRGLEMVVLNQMGIFFHVEDDSASARCHEDSLAIAEELGDEQGLLSALNRLSVLWAQRLDLRQALALAERAQAIAEGHDDGWWRSQALDALKLVALMLGDTERLEELTRELSEDQRQRKALWYLQWTLQESAFASTARARWDEAAGRLAEALELSHRIGDTIAVGLILMAMCRLEQSRGDYARALQLGEEAVSVCSRDLGRRWLGWVAGAAAEPLADLRAWPSALSLLEKALSVAEGIDARAQTFGVLGAVAWARLQTGDRAGALAAAEQWDQMAAEVRTPPGKAYLYAFQTYVCRARVALACGQLDRAEAILNALRDPVAQSGIRDAAAQLAGALAGCAEARGDYAAADVLLTQGLEAAGDSGLHASRLALRIALARLSPAPELHVSAARELIDQIAGSVGTAVELADGFRGSAEAELDQLLTAPA